MPYVAMELRRPVDAALDVLQFESLSSGQFAYLVYRALQRFAKGVSDGGFIAMAFGCGIVVLALARYICKDVMAYEDTKEAQNGPIPEPAEPKSKSEA